MMKHFVLGYSYKICFDKIDRHLERKKTMDFELLGYLERWNIYFWMQLVVNKMGQLFFAAPCRRYHKHLNRLHDYVQ